MRQRTLIVALTVALLAALVWGAPSGGSEEHAGFLVGTAKVDISPSFPYPDGDIYIGGVIPGPLRRATGNLAPTYARAVAISTADGSSGVVLGVIDTQGQFGAYRQGPYGLDDIQREAAAVLGLDPWHILLSSNHSHAGADAMGLWGGVPESYLAFLKESYLAAVIAAWEDRRPARLMRASTNARDLLQNQSRYQDELDDELRVLVAMDPATGAPIAFLPNWQGHPSIVPGTRLHPDWPGLLNGILEERYTGAFSMTVLGAIGRTQTGRQGNTDAEVGVARATEYATELADRLEAALVGAVPVAAGPIDAARVWIEETAIAPALLALTYAGIDRVSDIYRSTDPPWLRDAVVVGVPVHVARIGDLVWGAAPGEAYPIIHSTLRDRAGATATFFKGLGGEQVGYLVAPEEDVPFVATDVNDNVLFMVSPSIGDHVRCALLAGAAEVGFPVQPLERCARWAGDPVDGGS